MPGPLTLPIRAPAAPAAIAGATGGALAHDGAAGEFEGMLQAGLAGRAGAVTLTAAGPAGARPAVVPRAQSGTAAGTPASGDANADSGSTRKTEGEEGASDLLVALLASGTGAVATAFPAAACAESPAVAPGARPVPADQLPEAEPGALAAAMVQPTPVQPDLTQHVPLESKPVQSSPVGATPQQSAPAQPTLAQPPLGQVTPEPPAIAPEATETRSSRDGEVESSTAVPARPGRTVDTDPLQKDPAATAASDAEMPRADMQGFAAALRELPARPGNTRADASRPLVKSVEARTTAAEDPTDVAANVPPARQERSEARDALRNATVSSGVARREEGHWGPPERAADRAADPVVRMETIQHAPAAPRPDLAPPLPERAGPIPLLHVDYSLGSAQWQREFGTQVSLLVSRREPQAEIRLNPAQLGPVEIRIGVQGDQVSLAFSALQPETRAAIENALPQLREMLAGSGLALGHASVGAESSGQPPPRSAPPHPAPFLRDEPVVVHAAPVPGRLSVRLVDTFA